jgi:hypothetical protein
MSRYNTRSKTLQSIQNRQNETNIFENLAVIVQGIEILDESEEYYSSSSNSNSSSSASSNSQIMATINKMSVWAKAGLDPTDSTFAKIYDAAIKFNDTDDDGKALKKFKLDGDRFEELRSLLVRRVNKMAMKKLMKVTQDGDEFQLIDQAQLVTEATMVAARNETWDSSKDPKTSDNQDDVNKIMDQRIKYHALGTWLLNALTTDAVHRLEHAKSQYIIEKDDEPYVHGPSLWWLIVADVKPNNDTLIQNAKERLNELNVKNFDFSVKDMLTEFDTIVVEIESRLKGSITEDERISALWKSLETMKEEKFSKIVFDEKRTYRNATAVNKLKCDELVRLFKREQTNMEADKIWNKPSDKDQKIIALTSILDSVVKSVNNAINTHTPSNPSDHSNPPNKRARKPKSVPSWKYENDNDLKECQRDDKTWYWCPKHNNPNEGKTGMWVRHTPEEHKQDFRFNPKDNSRDSKPGTASKDTTNTQDGSQPAVKVDTKMFQALKSGADIQVFLNRLSEHNKIDLN